MVGFGLCLLFVLLSGGAASADEADDKERIIGRWDVTVTTPAGDSYPSWFEVQKSGHQTLVGRYVGRFGSARPISEVIWADGRMTFEVPPQWEGRGDRVRYEGAFDGDVLKGTTTDDDGRPLTWVARPAPALDSDRPVTWEAPVPLFNGRDLSGWKTQFPDAANGWIVRDGLLVNDKPGNNLITEATFGDFRLQAEFRYPKGSNSGLYLRGRYELQIEDNFGEEADSHRIGGVYGFLTPCVNAAKRPLEWQTYDVTLVGRRVTVLLNGERVIDRQILPGITGGALNSDEAEFGPIMIQGDHGPVEFRSLILTPAAE